MKTILKHLRVFLYIARYSIIRDLEFRMDFISNFVSSLAWLNFSLFLILVVNANTNGFGDWRPPEMLVLAGVWMINNGMAFFLFYRTIKQVISDVFTGSLDSLLLKPLDSQFFASSRRVAINSFSGVIEGLVVISYALGQLHYQPQLVDIFKFGLLAIVGISIYYSLWFMAATMSFHLTMVDNLFSTVPEVIFASKFPPPAYPKGFALIFSSMIPVLLMTAFPAKQLLGALPISNFVYAVAIGGLFLFLSRRFWFWSLRSYTSASS